MKPKQFTKATEAHLKKIGLAFNPEGLKREAEELIKYIEEDKICVIESGDVFIQINEQKDWDYAVKLAESGYCVTIRSTKDFDVKRFDLSNFEAVIVGGDDPDNVNESAKEVYLAYEQKPSNIEMEYIMQGIIEGKWTLLNLETANNRRPNVKGYIPSIGALVDSYGLVGLTAVDISKFVVEGHIEEEDGTLTPTLGFDSQDAIKAQALATRENLRRLLEKQPKEIKLVQLRDTLLGVALIGVKETAEKLGWDDNQVDSLINALQGVAHEEAMGYAGGLRLPLPMLVTTMIYGETSTFEEYIRYQKFYSDANTPTVVKIKESELESYKDLILDNWEWYIAVNFKVEEE